MQIRSLHPCSGHFAFLPFFGPAGPPARVHAVVVHADLSWRNRCYEI